MSFYPTRHHTKNSVSCRFIRQDIKQKAVSCVVLSDKTSNREQCLASEMSTPYAKASIASPSREEGITKPTECKQALCPVHSERTQRFPTVKIHRLSAVTVSPLFLLIHYRPSFYCYSIIILSAVTVSPFFHLLQYRPSFCCYSYSITLLSSVTVSPFSLLLQLQYRSSFYCYSSALLSTVTVSPFFLLYSYSYGIALLSSVTVSPFFILLQ